MESPEGINSWPPPCDSLTNAGMFMTGPSKIVFDYCMSIRARNDSYKPEYAEQNLLNNAHRWSGNMPFDRFKAEYILTTKYLSSWNIGGKRKTDILPSKDWSIYGYIIWQ